MEPQTTLMSLSRAWSVKIRTGRVDDKDGSAAVHGVVTPRPVRCGGLAEQHCQLRAQPTTSQPDRKRQ